MARAAVLLLVLAAACRTRIEGERASDVYAGVGLSGLPDLGGAVTAGQTFSRAHPRSDFAFELRAAYQRGDDAPTQDGKFAQVQAGVRQVAAPGHPRGWVFRYGVTWLRATGDPALLDVAGDYFGLYGGVAYEWVRGRWRFGPEVALNVVNGEGSVDWEALPQAGFHVYFDF